MQRKHILALFTLIACSSFHAFAQAQERINAKPNLNGVWQAMNTAHWNLEGHSA